MLDCKDRYKTHTTTIDLRWYYNQLWMVELGTRAKREQKNINWLMKELNGPNETLAAIEGKEINYGINIKCI